MYTGRIGAASVYKISCGGIGNTHNQYSRRKKNTNQPTNAAFRYNGFNKRNVRNGGGMQSPEYCFVGRYTFSGGNLQ